MPLVAGIQLAHVPVMPGAAMASDGAKLPEPIGGILASLHRYVGPDIELMRQMKDRLEALEPDAIVFFDCDHVHTFFLNHVPSVAVGVEDTTAGPSDRPLGHPYYAQIPVDRDLGDRIHRDLIERDFDVSRVQRFEVDHSIATPLHFITPKMDVPMVPVWINGLGGVPIRAQRALALGKAVREIIDDSCPDRRVVVLSSGALSVDIGTPRVIPGEVFGIPDPDWVSRASELVQRGEIDRLVREATPERICQAGNAAPEILSLIAVAGATGGKKPDFFELRKDAGHVFCVWMT